MTDTATWGLPYPLSSNTVNVPGDIQALAVDVDAALTVVWKPFAAIAVRSAAQAIPNSAFTDVTFPTEEFDNASMFTPGGATITIPASAGANVVCTITAGGVWLNNGTGTRAMILLVNGVELPSTGAEQIPSGSAVTRQTISTEAKLQPGDQLKIQAYQSCGVALNLNIARFTVSRKTQ